MSFLKAIFRKIFCFWSKKIFHTEYNSVKIIKTSEYSQHLKQNVHSNIYLPYSYEQHRFCEYGVLFLNDAQDMERVKLVATLEKLYAEKRIQPIIVCAFFPQDRMHEYGTRNQLDYAGRGKLANAYQDFLIEEFIPFLRANYRIKKAKFAVAGFSLGGLAAFDLAWHFPAIFDKVGVFSGALWWRSEKFNPQNPDADRIIHMTIEQAKTRPNQKYWLQTGTNDETEDRNNNGIIDSIDDTLDLIAILKAKGLPEKNITYREVEGGEHTPETWGKVMPEFLEWAFGDTY